MKNAIVTGGAAGIGAAISISLARRGFAVAINYRSGDREANDLVAAISEAGGVASAIKADIGVAGEAARLFDLAEKTLGGVDVLVNNAGRAIRKPLADFSDEEFDAVLRPNFFGAFSMMREAARRMRDGGRIINISMSHQGAPIPGYSVYAASKAALEEMTRVAARELGSRRITVNALRPGPTRTRLFLEGKTPEMIAHFAGQTALGRLGEPEDAAHVVAFLTSDEGGWVTGQAFAANGGYW
jgi:3-oxoacyl-[acyl-carrier protein] reductase